MRANIELAELTLSPITNFTLDFEDPTSRSIAELSSAIQQVTNLYRSGKITDQQIIEGDELLALIRAKRLYNFIMAVNAQLDPLNTLIHAYNHADTPEDKSRLLNEIITVKTEIDALYPESAIKLCPEYISVFYEKMTIEIQSQQQQLATHLTETSSHRYRLSELLETMPPVKLNHLLQILCDKKQYDEELEKLYLETEVGYKEFNQFLRTHAISFIGGHNSSNLLIEPTENSVPPYVLKIENRLNQPQNIARHFAKTVLKEIIPQSDIACRAWFTRHNSNGRSEVIIRTIMTQPYYPSGSIYQHAFTQRKPHQRINSALGIYKQMGHILLELSQNGGAFPDMKNTNWLIDDRQKLQFADDKSLRWQNPDGTLDVFSDNSQWYGDILKSPEYMPPEVFQNNTPILVDTLHVFTWGKNLYEYLTVTHSNSDADNTYLKKMNGADFNFDKFSIFSIEPEGPLLKQLIIDTVKPEATQRISMKNALERLDQIQMLIDLRTSLSVILFSSDFAPDIIIEYMQHALSSIDPNTLSEYTQETNRPALVSSVETFQNALLEKYDEAWSVQLDTIKKILSTYPNEEMQACYEDLLEQRQNLKPCNYKVFTSDVADLYEEAKNLEEDSTMSRKNP